jgi:hypothetical protein
MSSTLQRIPANAVKSLTHLVREMTPVVLFFFAGLMIILVILKLFVAQYSIEFYAFTRAAVGALILGKVVLLMEWAESRHGVSRYPGALVVAGKTFLYALAVIAFGLGERIIHGTRTTGSLRRGISLTIANANLDRFLGLVLLISLLVATYLVMEEISRAMGKGALFRLFFAARPGGW